MKKPACNNLVYFETMLFSVKNWYFIIFFFFQAMLYGLAIHLASLEKVYFCLATVKGDMVVLMFNGLNCSKVYCAIISSK